MSNEAKPVQAFVEKPKTLAALRAEIAEGRTKAADLATSYYERIAQVNPRLNVYLSLTKERAQAQAARIDELAAKGDPLPALAGIPVGIKDVLVVQGAPSTAGSKILKGYHPPYDATAVSKLEAAGAVLLGKLNCDEFAMGSSNENSAYGPVRNPVDTERVPGGSSGGSAAAVAADLAVVSLGTDTGGPIRQPGACCGIPAMMPTYGRVSRYGLTAFASSLDRIGPFSKNVRDAAEVFNVIAGADPNDSTSARVPVPDYTAGIEKPIAGTRIGVPDEYFAAGLNEEVRQKIESGIALLEKLGAVRVPLQLPHTEYAIATYYVIATAEASSNLARYDGVRYGIRAEAATLSEMYRKTRRLGFGAEVKRRIMLGTYALSSGYYDAYYLRAQKVRSLIARDFAQAFERVDVIVTPTSPTAPFRLGERTSDPLQMYLADIYTVTGSLAGLTGISVPCGKAAGNLPIGMQILGSHFKEARVLQIAHAFELAGGFEV